MKRCTSALAVLLAITATSQAYAAGYFGLGLGQSFVDIEAPGDASVDEKDTSFKIFGGVTFNPHLKLEFAYADLGEASAEIPVFLFTIPVSNIISLKTTAISAAVIGQANVSDNFGFYGKLGIARWDSEVNDEYRALVTATPQSISVSSSDSGFSPTFGFGIDVKVSSNISLRAEWERYTDVADGLTYTDALGFVTKVEGEDIDNFAAGVSYNF